jgi:signal transduction histidine kinase/pSer/pThr/pTyr-binding forkhead associated (FHA) protein
VTRSNGALASLTIIKGPDKGRQFDITGDRPTVGRDNSSAVRLHDGEISRHHAEFRRAKNGYVLYDLQSSNGTYLNGERVQFSPIKTGDRIRFGQTEMIFTADPAAPRTDLAGRISMTAGSGAENSAILSSLKQSHFSELLQKPEKSGSEWLRDSLSNLNTMYETSEAIRRLTDTDELLERIMDLAFEAVRPDRGCIMLKDPETGVLLPKAIRYAPDTDHEERITISRSITDYAMEKGEGIIVADAQHDARFSASDSVAELGIREAICVPLSGRHDTLGVLYVDIKSNNFDVLRTQKPGKLKENHLKLMVAIAYQAGIALEDTRFYEASVHAERLAAVGQTIATLSHHIKNILQGLRSGSYLVNMGIEGHTFPVVEQGWGIVQKNQEKIYNLVMDMLSYSKEREPTLELVDINDIVREIVELMSARAAESKVEIITHLDSTIDRIAIDPDGVNRALLNIVTNAIDALEDVDHERRIEIKTGLTQNGRYLHLSVKDNGPGIPSEEQKRVFQIFHSTKGSKGTGLGLAVSQKIIQEHGGQIKIDSQSGKGASFVIEIPVRRQIIDENHAEPLSSSIGASDE